ncbi:DUF397 domain-containing protein [Streptomyces bacillaris]|uniref:DUF397 domain-containing protein n=1 Tax=Streptomyces bacillaris TaxID=68179 RepID=UPI00346057EF
MHDEVRRETGQIHHGRVPPQRLEHLLRCLDGGELDGVAVRAPVDTVLIARCVCVEGKVMDANLPGVVRARDSKDIGLPEVRVPAAAWGAFVAYVGRPEV